MIGNEQLSFVQQYTDLQLFWNFVLLFEKIFMFILSMSHTACLIITRDLKEAEKLFLLEIKVRVCSQKALHLVVIGFHSYLPGCGQINFAALFAKSASFTPFICKRRKLADLKI